MVRLVFGRAFFAFRDHSHTRRPDQRATRISLSLWGEGELRAARRGADQHEYGCGLKGAYGVCPTRIVMYCITAPTEMGDMRIAFLLRAITIVNFETAL